MKFADSNRVPLKRVYGGNQFYLDYMAGRVNQYFSHPKGAMMSALTSRQEVAVPRPALAETLAIYNSKIGGSATAVSAASSLASPKTFCVHTGQQAGFMGGPVFTFYKITTAIRLAAQFEKEFGHRCVPVFWLASEDHDLREINHAHYVKSDGSVGRESFEWDYEGRSINQMSITDEIESAADRFFDWQKSNKFAEYAKKLFAPRGDNFARSIACSLSQLFSDYGLVIIEPHLLRPLFPEFFRQAASSVCEIQQILQEAAISLKRDGYSVPLDSRRSGTLFQSLGGDRVRLLPKEKPLPGGELSTDAALRPVLADLALPSIATVLGAGEVSYQAMLKGLYQLFSVPQPLIVARKSYTIIPLEDAASLSVFNLRPSQIIGPNFSAKEAFKAIVPMGERANFAKLEKELSVLWNPLRPYVEAIDPNLVKTWERSLSHAQLAVERLEDRATSAFMSQRGTERSALQRIREQVWPRGRPQERILPIAYFVSLYGPQFVQSLLSVCNLQEQDHEILLPNSKDFESL